MLEDLFIEFRSDHIYISQGADFEITPDGMEAFWSFLAEQCRQYKCTSVLVEGTAPKRRMDTVAAFSSGVEAANVVPHLWLALCFHDYEPDELSQLFRQAARNRGANVNFFSRCDDALGWLRANNPHFD